MDTESKTFEINRERYDHYNEEKLRFKSKPGLSEEVIHKISDTNKEPEWMREFRIRSYNIFKQMPMPNWGPSLDKLDLNNIFYFMVPDAKENATKWSEVPEDIKKTFDKLGIPEAEKNALGGVGAQYESQVVYHNLKKQWEDKGVIFKDCSKALIEHEQLFKEHFMSSCVPVTLHKFAALHGAVWSGGTFIYVPPKVNVGMPLQAYFRMNAMKGGQFEHTLIIVDEGATVQYIEGCSAPVYNMSSLHAGCVEVHVKKGARARYSSIENWSKNTFNLNTKRAIIDEDGIMEWVNGNMGSNATMLYPCSVLKGKRAKSDYIGIAFAGKDQHQDTGHKVYHLAEDTRSTVIAKSISKNGGISSYRGSLNIVKGAINSKTSIRCDALMMDDISKSNTFPYMQIKEKKVDVAHEATVGKISEDQIFYLQSRGIKEDVATNLIVSGFIEPIVKELPLEYAVELNRLIELEMEGSLG